LQFKNPKNYELVYEALNIENRKDLIGFHEKALIKPKEKVQETANYAKKRPKHAAAVKKTKKRR
jgi:hypothetical protein